MSSQSRPITGECGNSLRSADFVDAIKFANILQGDLIVITSSYSARKHRFRLHVMR